MSEHVIIATPKSRITALFKLALWPLAAYGLLMAARFYSNHVGNLATCEQLPWLRLYVAAVAGLLVSLSLLSARYGWRIWSSGQYPAPGTSVLFTTRVWSGWWARLNAICVLAVCILLIVALAALLQYFVFSEVGLYVTGLRSCEA